MSYAVTKKLNIKARLRKDTFANFLEYYHNGTPKDDYFYKYLKKLVASHNLLTQPNIIFKTSFTEEGFYFKTKPTLKCMNITGKPCLISDLLDQDVLMTLKILPYNFNDPANKQIIGISIQATHIRHINI